MGDYVAVNSFFERLVGIGVNPEGGTVSVVCVLSGDGAHIAGLLMQVGPEARPLATKAHTTGRTVAHQFNLNEIGKSATEFLDALLSGTLATPLGALALARSEWSAPIVILDENAAIGLQQRWIALDIDNVSIAVGAAPSIDWHLRAQPELYDGLEDLKSAFGVAGLGHQCRIVMSVLAIIDGASEVKGENALVKVRLANGLARSQFRLGYKIVTREGQVTRANMVGDGLTWGLDPEAAFQTGSVTIAVPKAAAVQCVAVYAERAFHYWWISDERTPHNIRRGVLQLYDDRLEKTTTCDLSPYSSSRFW